MTLSPMIRTAIMVADLDKSVAFYNDVLEITEVYYDGELEHPAAAKLLGMPEGVRTRAQILRVPGPDFGMIGLFECTNPEPPQVEKRRDGINIGDMCMVFYCDDLDPVYERLVKGNHRVICPPTFLKVDDLIGQREMTFLDPDGALLNLIEWDPEKGDRFEYVR